MSTKASVLEFYKKIEAQESVVSGLERGGLNQQVDVLINCAGVLKPFRKAAADPDNGGCLRRCHV